ncbi:hypothetical protein ACHAQA_004303 [Verticillium albo-atrum]
MTAMMDHLSPSKPVKPVPKKANHSNNLGAVTPTIASFQIARAPLIPSPRRRPASQPYEFPAVAAATEACDGITPAATPLELFKGPATAMRTGTRIADIDGEAVAPMSEAANRLKRQG